MKGQWTLIIALIFALVVAIFAVINVDPVAVNFLFGTAEWPLILVIISSVLMGGVIVASAGIFRMFLLQRRIKQLERENSKLIKENEELTSTQLIDFKETHESLEKNKNHFSENT